MTVCRPELQSFFDTFSASDLYVELSDLVRSSRLIDNVDFYLHVCKYTTQDTSFLRFTFPSQRSERSKASR